MIEATTRPLLGDDALIFGDCHIATSLPGQSKNASRPHNQLPNAYFRSLLGGNRGCRCKNPVGSREGLIVSVADA
jgi:hypothetical protein